MTQARWWICPLALLTLPVPMPGQAAGLPPLAFFGFEAGQPLAVVATQAQALGSRGFVCRVARRDASVRECRATLLDPVGHQPVELWLSSMDSLSGVLTVSGEVTGEQLEGWKTELEAQYGLVGARVQGPQWMMQWVRQGRMLRLTWRIDQGRRSASVSLVDGHVLDSWAERRARSHRPGDKITGP